MNGKSLPHNKRVCMANLCLFLCVRGQPFAVWAVSGRILHHKGYKASRLSRQSFFNTSLTCRIADSYAEWNWSSNHIQSQINQNQPKHYHPR